jgi:beta-N-acetylhexosaminidase
VTAPEGIDDDIGQLLWLGFHGAEVPAELAQRIAAGGCGAVILFKRNLRVETRDGVESIDLDALARLVDELHRAAPASAPLLVAVDQEGGVVQRVRAPATRWPPMMVHDRLGADAVAVAEEVGLAMGAELRALGFDIDFAPVLDIHTNDGNPIIGDRAFGRDADAVAERALAFARGLDRAGVLSCGKHFPGHGDTTTDSHLELPRIDHPWERLEQVELAPFARAADAGVPMIMTAHVVFAAIDPTVPATLSPAVIEGVLRGKLGYRGVIVSDDLDMKAVAAHVGVGEAAVAAIRAGCDALLLCQDPDHQRQAEAALRAEVARDPGFAARIAEAAARVRAMKAAHAARQRAVPAPGRDVIGCERHQQLAARLAALR